MFEIAMPLPYEQSDRIWLLIFAGMPPPESILQADVASLMPDQLAKSTGDGEIDPPSIWGAKPAWVSSAAISSAWSKDVPDLSIKVPSGPLCEPYIHTFSMLLRTYS